jgi:hypothetical protein
MLTDALRRAYLATDYVVIAGGEITVRIGQHQPQLDGLLEQDDAKQGIFITAWNPQSMRQDDETNDAAHKRLVAALGKLGLSWYPHIGRAKHWQEKGCFVLDLDDASARKLARRFRQNAIVRIARNERAELLIVAPPRTQRSAKG